MDEMQLLGGQQGPTMEVCHYIILVLRPRLHGKLMEHILR
jgi:hypothetical protein